MITIPVISEVLEFILIFLQISVAGFFLPHQRLPLTAQHSLLHLHLSLCWHLLMLISPLFKKNMKAAILRVNPVLNPRSTGASTAGSQWHHRLLRLLPRDCEWFHYWPVQHPWIVFQLQFSSSPPAVLTKILKFLIVLIQTIITPSKITKDN